jgi:MoxR-like ATPase
LDELKAGKDEVDITTLNDSLVWYIASLIRSTRVLPAVQLGASPRAGVHLLACAKAMARFNDRSFVIPEDIAQIAVPVLAHRLVLKPEADLDRYKPADAIRTTLASVPIPR